MSINKNNVRANELENIKAFLKTSLKSKMGFVHYAVSNCRGAENYRNAIIIGTMTLDSTGKRSWIVGKDFIVDEDGFVSWSWGTYDITSEGEAIRIANKWING